PEVNSNAFAVVTGAVNEVDAAEPVPGFVVIVTVRAWAVIGPIAAMTAPKIIDLRFIWHTSQTSLAT
ncbi:MAG: hypothetical protein D6773_01580, partial [Alphaproteobacteria bacterium]